MFYRLGHFVAGHRVAIAIFWISAVVLLRAVAPPWDEVTYDGDLAYLPDRAPSVTGEQLLSEAFPHDHAKSQLVVVLQRDDGRLDEDDIRVGYDVARRLKNLHGATALHEVRRLEEQAAERRAAGAGLEAQQFERRAGVQLEEAQRALDEALAMEKSLADDRGAQHIIDPLGWIAWNRGLVAQRAGRTAEAEAERQRALILNPALASQQGPLPAVAADLPILDVWTWRDDVFGRKLVSPDQQARLIVVQLANEFLATRNQPLLEQVHRQLDGVRAAHEGLPAGLSLSVSGSAAVGGDMLLSARESIEDTELFTVLLIVAILVSVYRAPLLVAIPLMSIAVSLLISTSCVALLARLAEWPSVAPWWGFKVFTTTKIFIVVILYGAGTDYCLFLISRYREELEGGASTPDATARALSGVGDALTASALTTIVGLAMMFFSEFGKFRYSGPVIGFCLTVTLLVCLTLTPALLSICGRAIFWPRRLRLVDPQQDRLAGSLTSNWSQRLWARIGSAVVRRPGLILVASVLILTPLAGYGLRSAHHVTYDVLSSLAPQRPSRVGAEHMRRHFPVGESGPLTIVLYKPGADFESQPGRDALYGLAHAIYEVPGVGAVRSLVDPLGEYPPGTRIGLTNRRAWLTWLARAHQRTASIFLAQTPRFPGDLTRVDVVLDHDPFSREATDALRRLDNRLHRLVRDPQSYWNEALVAYSGPTASVRDLREITQSDRRRIEILVTLAVYVALVVILRRPLVCIYLMASVLFTYFVTIGITQTVFAWAYGPTYDGLDWKVPLFLFVILVAVGQDYNVYLVTRVFEEQQRAGPFAGLRRAVSCTGGIITSCGVIMAGTFISMTSVVWNQLVPDWLPWLARWLAGSGGLRSMIELGFALALGVCIDTFIVRPVLVPAFLALLCRVRAGRNLPPEKGLAPPG